MPETTTVSVPFKSSDLLLGAAAVIERFGHTKNVFARNKHGKSAHPFDAEASCFCALGAMRRASLELASDQSEPTAMSCPYIEARNRARVYVRQALQGEGLQDDRIAAFNDHTATTPQDVINLLHASAALAALEDD